MNFYAGLSMNFPAFITPEVAKSGLWVSLTLLGAILADNILRSLIKIPKHFETRRTRTYVSIIRNIITVVIYGIALNIIFLIFNINITPLLASAGILGVVVGLGARALIEDLINGLFLLSQDKITLGDYIKIDLVEGMVENMGFRTLSIRAENGSLTIIPNGQVKQFTNFSRHRANVFVDLPVKADMPIDTVLKAMNEALDQLRADPKFGENVMTESKVEGIDDVKAVGPMIVRATIVITPEMRWDVARKYRYLAKKEFEKHKIAFG